MFGMLPSQTAIENICSQQHHNTDKCTCQSFMRTLQECTDLLGKRLLDVVTTEVEQFQASVRQEMFDTSMDSDGIYYDADSTMMEDDPEEVQLPEVPDAGDTIVDMLEDASKLLLIVLEKPRHNRGRARSRRR